MSVPTLEDLYGPLTKDDVLATILAFAVQLDLPVTAWQEGSAGRELLEIIAQQLANQTDMGQVTAAGGLLDYAVLGWLTLCADQVFDVQRQEATYAQGPLTLTNYSATPYVLAPGDVRAYVAGIITSPPGASPIVRSAPSGNSGATFSSTDGGTLPAAVGTFGLPGFVPGTLTLAVVADIAGTGSSCLAGELSALATPISGVIPYNPGAMVASDDELDPPLRARCRASMARVTLNGPEDAYRYYATSAVYAGSPAGCTRVYVQQNDGSNVVYCAGDSGAIQPGPAFDAIVESVQSNCVPTGLGCDVRSAENLVVPVRMTLFLSALATVTDAEAAQAAVDNLGSLYRGYPIGGISVPQLSFQGLFLNVLEQAGFAAAPGQVLQVTVQDPPANVPMTATQVAVLGATTAASITVVRVQQS